MIYPNPLAAFTTGIFALGHGPQIVTIDVKDLQIETLQHALFFLGGSVRLIENKDLESEPFYYLHFQTRYQNATVLGRIELTAVQFETQRAHFSGLEYLFEPGQTFTVQDQTYLVP